MAPRQTRTRKKTTRGPDLYERGLDRVGANYVPLTPLSFLARAASVYPRKAAVIHGERSFTYAQFSARCRRLASALRQRGIGRGDIVFQNGTSGVALDTALSVSSFGEDEAGEIYVVDLDSTISRIANASCVASLSPDAQALPTAGGSVTVAVTIPAGCEWTAVSNVDWITTTGGERGAAAAQ